MARMGDILSELREDKGLTQLQLSKQLHISNSSVSAYETGARTPNVDVLVSLAQFYDVTTDYLLGRTAEPVSPSVLSEELAPGVTAASVIQTLKMLTPEQRDSILLILENMRFYSEVTQKTSSGG